MLAQSMDKLYEQGIGKGIEQDKIEIAGRMLDDGLSTDIVAKYTELSEEVIEQLRKEK